MHDLVRGGGATTRARSGGLPEGAGGLPWLLADGRRLALLVALLLVAALGVIKALDREPWATPFTPLLLAAPYAVAVGLGAAASGARLRGVPALELVGRQGPSLAQIAGMACAGCGAKIIVETEGTPCELCRVPCHDPCRVGHRAEHKRLEAPHPYR
ncbi:MAG TPA: hypothetical protein VFS00_00970 [Polyangiaceae bacterium]|nr:hypothetical protein [Polyangiaceae bacterium]